MKARVIRIGNSRGIRLPKAILQEAGLEDEVEIRVRGGSIVITPAKHRRAGWAEAAARLAQLEGTALLDDYMPTRFDEEEWEWR
jgi:antitoxin MazE